jgi:hypothetical protein
MAVSSNPRQDFINRTSRMWEPDQARLDQAVEEQKELARLDSITDPRERWIAGNAFAQKFGYYPGEHRDNTPLPRQDGEDPRSAFIRQSAELGGQQKRADATTITCRRDRLDSMATMELRHDMSQMTSQGFLLTDATVTRCGIFNYRDDSGKLRRELRSPEEVFSQEAMDSLKMAPVCYGPPGEVDVKNVKQYQVGTIGENIKRSGDYVSCKLQITVQSVIDDLKAGRISGQISCGYNAEVEPVAGSWRGQQYDCVQRRIRYNHVSLVDQGRAGADVRLQLN